MPVPTEIFAQLTLQSLFVPPPIPQAPADDPIAAILDTLDTLATAKPYTTFITISNLSRQYITSTEPTDETIPTIFAMWETHLTALIFAHELALAQQESKRLSIALESIVKTSAKGTPQKTQRASSSGAFPANTPYSLKLLITRLRSNGPTVQAINEAYAMLWEARMAYTRTDKVEKKVVYKQLLHVLCYGIGATLIAKREYGTFLTLVHTVDDRKMTFLGVLVSLMKGDWDLASQHWEQIGGELPRCVEALQFVVKNVNPVLDPNREDTGSDIEIQIEKVDDLFELIKTHVVTGRIACALCAVFELELRDAKNSGDDLLRGELTTGNDVAASMFKLWKGRSSKLYAFE